MGTIIEKSLPSARLFGVVGNRAGDEGRDSDRSKRPTRLRTATARQALNAQHPTSNAEGAASAPQIWVVSGAGDLKDWHHEIHQKHRHAFARGLLDHRWSFRVRLEYRPSHFPALHCGAGRRHLYSHRQIMEEKMTKRLPSPSATARQAEGRGRRGSTVIGD